ncbi:hypothetical protein M407DRAFT_107349 [Tulasnella calospora MUT 4182]|uniref:Uncharacterized protein n=1 Tax=Tulasnella calospora MUT 4182 TaxID=1051891 RepID=A0A0C3LQR2_9AGAM|nr:hypothetical protein M407DRAFT_107349 [Tulasnella calospora MUT 4182]
MFLFGRERTAVGVGSGRLVWDRCLTSALFPTRPRPFTPNLIVHKFVLEWIRVQEGLRNSTLTNPCQDTLGNPSAAAPSRQ